MAPYIKNKRTEKPTELELYTGGKFPEMAVFYNVAFFRVAGLIHQLLGNPKAEKDIFDKDKKALEDTYTKWVSKDEKDRDANDDRVLSKLKDYLWKGYLNAKNSSGSVLEETDKWLIIEILKKLEKIRNFHSHAYHDNSVLVFSDKLKKYIEDFHTAAKLSFMEQFPNEVKEYDEWLNEQKNKKYWLFSHHDGKNYITVEGRTFFLSFFVTRGEMARFLQQRKGSKRNDTDKYKLKQKIYRYYTHRDGAARQHYGHEETILSGLPAKEQEEILMARQAAKLISYLNDQPALCSDTHLFPLYNNGVKAETAEELILFCKANKLLAGRTIQQVVKLKDDVETVQENRIEFIHNGYSFHIGKDNFHKLLVSLVNVSTTEENIIAKLNQFITEREHITKLLETDFTQVENETGKITINDELDQYYRFKLRNEKLQKAMGAWLEKIEKGTNEKTYILIGILEERPPIEIRYYDLFFEENQKPRMTDRFVEFAVKYLIDFKIVPDWCWMVEHFETIEQEKEVLEYDRKVLKKVMVNKRMVSYAPQIPKDSRLSITDDGQVTVGIYKENEAEQMAKGIAPKHKFVLGHRAIKNLLIAHLDKKIISPFFIPIVNDLEAIQNQQKPITIEKLQILHENEIPASYKRLLGAKHEDHTMLRAKAISRMNSIIEKLEGLVPNKDTGETILKLSKAEKNRQIMKCYTYFDWNYPQNSQFKFLRKDEYQQMSVYHYCLEKRGRVIDKGFFNKNEGYYFLIKNAEQHMPKAIKDMLAKAKDIDDLLAMAATAVVEILTGWQNSIQHIKGKNLKTLLNKIGVPNGGAPVLGNYIPFDIHPMLVLRKFYEKELAAGKFSLSAIIRENTSFQKGLTLQYYQYSGYIQNYLPAASSDSKKINKYIIGEANDQLTKDTILWQAAQKYLEGTNSTYRSFLMNGKNQTEWKVGNLRKTPVEIDFEGVADFDTVTLQIKFHQLDDYLLMESKPIIKRIIWQILKRHEAGYKPLHKDEVAQLEITIDNGKYKLPYDEIFKEMQRINNEALQWAKVILHWEQAAVKTMDSITLKNIAKSNAEKGGDEYLDFRQVCESKDLDNTLKETLIDLRNKAFHAEVPADWTYWQKEQDKELCQLLEYTPKTKYDYENRVRKGE